MIIFIMNTNKDLIYAFIDSQNLNLGVLSLGWKLDFKSFRTFLSDKCNVRKAFLFMGYMPKYKKLYKLLESFGYILVFKKVIIDRNNVVKGNVDAELVLHSGKVEYQNYHKAIIVSGDGDFYCLHEELEKDGKLYKIIVPSRDGESSLLGRFRNYKIYVSGLRNKVERV
jgi:uncharacterized LabA/DUF88 family protein